MHYHPLGTKSNQANFYTSYLHSLQYQCPCHCQGY
uniref:Uncharacterized protein n=1 Tax=Arundo donax TaxID=35708 RepID=A0A0A9EZ39_ARUDO